MVAVSFGKPFGLCAAAAGVVREICAFCVAVRDQVIVNTCEGRSKRIGDSREREERLAVSRHNGGLGIFVGNGCARSYRGSRRIYDKNIVLCIVFNACCLGNVQRVNRNSLRIKSGRKRIVSAGEAQVNTLGLSVITGSLGGGHGGESGNVKPNSRKGVCFGKRYGFAALVFFAGCIRPAVKQILRTLNFAGSREINGLAFAFVNGILGRERRKTAGKVEINVEGSSFPKGIEGNRLLAIQVSLIYRIGRNGVLKSSVLVARPTLEIVVIAGKGGLSRKRNSLAGRSAYGFLRTVSAVAVKANGNRNRNFLELEVVERISKRFTGNRLLNGELNGARIEVFRSFEFNSNRAVFRYGKAVFAGQLRGNELSAGLGSAVDVKLKTAVRIFLCGEIYRNAVKTSRKRTGRNVEIDTSGKPHRLSGKCDLQYLSFAFIDDGNGYFRVLVG